ncbi:Putative aspartyl/glutamyl-tRNA amidotransferase subunit B, yqeY/Aim41 domain-containing protein [Septoria linicola]|uniref:Altered inheritance of mitochondria protein 41 n=1 Tax=Septoria linicola TaxID=215465 RepID=A0A9Q9AZ55_9PEZI|nr:putative aspartyl/glutamyl-tRNA amidotransferase subunit B, yqeY/Aim41 domain-containing protein [Septoria linicola]USW54537.1 Putative aspartyl/glutamyl-tRNA amidotransferase subunit B, yqeY/Aim41 domain-containing protein [Septoria linicola]
MSLNATRMLLRSKLALRNRNNWVCSSCQTSLRYSSTDAPASPLLGKLKGDLKTAMKAKDTNRLNVLRGVIAEVTNSAKGSNPIKTDMQLLSVLRKKTAAAKAAQEEFKAAGRDDLVTKEQQQVEVLDEYADSVEMTGAEEIQNAVQTVVDQAKAAAENVKVNMGDVLKKVLGPGGSLEGKPVDRAEVARVVKRILGQ